MMIKNSPEYQAAQWGEFYDLDWHQTLLILLARPASSWPFKSYPGQTRFLEFNIMDTSVYLVSFNEGLCCLIRL